MDLNRAFPIRADVASGGTITGVASTIGNVDRARRCFLPGAFGNKAFQVPLLAFHDDQQPLGTALLTPQGKQLLHAISLADLPRKSEFLEMIRAGAIPATSIGWVSEEHYWGWAELEAGNPQLAKKSKAAGVPQREDVHYFAKAEVVELSLVPVPANPLALIGAASLLTGSGEGRAVLDHMIEMATGRDAAAGSRHSRADQQAIQLAHDSLVVAGALCPAAEGSDDDDASGDVPAASIGGDWSAHTASGDEDGGEEVELPPPPPSTWWDSLVALLVSAELPRALADAIAADLAAVWTKEYVNNLPDSAFAWIAPGGKKDSGGKTVPRSLRHFPHHDEGGSPDEAHVRNALARIPQSNVPDSAKRTALSHVQKHAKALGIGDGSSGGGEDQDAPKDGQDVQLLDDDDFAALVRQVASLNEG